MSLLFAAALVASSTALPACSWDSPGRNVFIGDVPAAVDRYTDIPAPVRARLKQRMAAYQYDDVAAIRRDSIEGINGQRHYSDLRQMHFGASQVCATVTRRNWTDAAEERGLVYCEDEHCVIVPTVCRNVSRVTRAPLPPAAAPVAAAAPPADPPLDFDPPGAGAGVPTFASAAAPPTEMPLGLPIAPEVSGAGGGWVIPPVVGGIGGGGGPGNGIAGLPSTPLPPVPEPASNALLLGGLAALCCVVRRARLRAHR